MYKCVLWYTCTLVHSNLCTLVQVTQYYSALGALVRTVPCTLVQVVPVLRYTVPVGTWYLVPRYQLLRSSSTHPAPWCSLQLHPAATQQCVVPCPCTWCSSYCYAVAPCTLQLRCSRCNPAATQQCTLCTGP